MYDISQVTITRAGNVVIVTINTSFADRAASKPTVGGDPMADATRIGHGDVFLSGNFRY